ncbi:MAG: serpin family protein, partial [Candidatus Marinimicrobia bacterium]|nr:serpin family protein [Candidatus Neomarinimicrobiota bacterium]
MNFKKIIVWIVMVFIFTSCNEEEIIAVKNSDAIDGNNKFALKMFNQISQKSDKNIFISPYSISTALAMTYAGAKNDTKEEMRKTLNLHSNDNITHSSFQYLIKSINKFDKSNKDIVLKTANAIWVDNSFTIKKSYQELIVKKYYSSINGLDFKNKPTNSEKIINKWASKNTEGKIKEILPKGTISKQTRLVLTNAIYFLADWKNKFKKRYTKEKKFYLLDKEVSKVKMMHQSEKFNYFENEKMQIIEMSYKNERMSMLVFLPKENSRSAINSLLDFESFNTNLEKLQKQKVQLYLPKFQFDYFSSLKNVLQEMGMKQAFTMQADFTGINKNKRETLMISDVLHKAYIDVTEKGTEA